MEVLNNSGSQLILLQDLEFSLHLTKMIMDCYLYYYYSILRLSELLQNEIQILYSSIINILIIF